MNPLRTPHLPALAALLALSGDPQTATPRAPTEGMTERRPDLTPELVQAVDRGLAFLASSQSIEGSFGPPRARVAITALSALAFMAGGHTEGRGRYRSQVGRALEYLIRCVDRSDPKSVKYGYITAAEDQLSRMHGHGYALLALAEAIGTTAGDSPRRKRLREALTLATRLAENGQQQHKDYGGWYYEPKAERHEGSVTICILEGLRAARNAGLKVDKGVIDRAVEYVRQSQHQETGGFRYEIGSERVSFALTAAAVCTLNAAGEYDDPVIHRGLDYMVEHWDKLVKDGEWYYYAGFYAAQAFYHAPPQRRLWERFWPKLRADLLEHQDARTGSFDYRGTDPEEYGPEYSTAMAMLVLQIPYQYLPIFQR